MRLAKRKKLLTNIPHIEKFSEKDNARQGFLSRKSWNGCWNICPTTSKTLHALPIIPGGARRNSHLEWSDIQDDVIRLKPQIGKNKDGRVIIIIGEIANIIAHRQAECVESCPYVFHRQGQ